MLGVSSETMAMLLRQAKRRARLKKKMSRDDNRMGYSRAHWESVSGMEYRK